MIETLPPEIIIHILDFLCADESTLVATSTVCRAWHIPSQCALVRYIYVIPPDLSRNSWREVLSNPAVPRPSISSHALIDLLTKYPVLCNYVSAFTAKATYTSDVTFYPEVTSLISSLPNLTYLALKVSDQETPCAEFLEGVMNALQGHRCLRDMKVVMNHVRVDLFAMLVDTNIQRLTVEDLPEFQPVDQLANWNLVALPMEVLHLSLSHQTLPLFWNVVRVAMPRLQRLEVESCDAQEVVALNAIFATPTTIPPSVKVLTHCIGDQLITAVAPTLDLRNVSIEHLCLTCGPYGTFSLCANWWRKAFDLLSVSHSLKKVTLVFDPIQQVQAYKELDVAIARLDVREVFFTRSADCFGEKIREVFPRLQRKGVLRLR